MTVTQEQITIVAALIRNKKGEVLLAKRNQPDIPEIDGMWEFAGGGIEFGEDPIKAIKREVYEELGVEVEVLRLLPKVFSDTQKLKGGKEVQVIIITYECKILSGTPGSGVDKETSEVKFIPLDQVKNYKTFRNIQATIALLITNHY